ncbi:class II glutamine amidotransferase [Eubacterium xylanophilum]|uniref:class II glutamine amidotransferase n=1 Tax=Eubacterium xylanophilum TaxID=39497 RepID=UPI00047BCE15|nr:class II glutamine amidotransferase [Eubacterium xylanophilum]
MCELFGVTSSRKLHLNELLEVFFSHSEEHRNGWGLAFLEDASVIKAPIMALKSLWLKNRLQHNIESKSCIAHIRRATIGDESSDNTHPFTGHDESGRLWVLAHNGTIFESDIIDKYQYTQTGTTDSERILLHIIDEINKIFRQTGKAPDSETRIELIERITRNISPGNKVNFILYDGELFYVHKNEAKTLYKRQDDDAVLFSTHPLLDGDWEEVAQNQLLVYKEGQIIYAGQPHENTYVHDESKMKLLYFSYSGL